MAIINTIVDIIATVSIVSLIGLLAWGIELKLFGKEEKEEKKEEECLDLDSTKS